LNLTEASYVFILDPWWNPQAEMQAIARAHRIGQDKSVIAMKFITRNTIEEKILALQQRKAKLATDILDSPEKMELTKSDLEALI
jgi:SNF2 family DNA or RNA helicase